MGGWLIQAFPMAYYSGLGSSMSFNYDEKRFRGDVLLFSGGFLKFYCLKSERKGMARAGSDTPPRPEGGAG